MSSSRWFTTAALLLLLAGFWPPTFSLRGLTGEEELLAQLRGVPQWVYGSIRPQPALATHALAPSALPPFGINTFLEQEALPEVRDESLRLIKEAGFAMIRQPFVWADIEIHGKGDFVDRRNDPAGVDAWLKYDNIVELADQNGIQITARLDKPPAWSRAEPPDVTGDFAPPDDYADFVDFAAAVAERYKGRIRYYQIWNEPNGNEEWGKHQPVNPEEYTELLCLTYERIKEIDPEAVVLMGALTPTVAVDGRNLNDIIYLQRMYLAGAGDCFDILSAQGYGLWSGATDHRLRPTVINYPHHLLLRDVMVQNGDGHKELWISEMGWNSVPETLPANFGRVSEAQQGQYAVEAYQRIVADWPWVGVGNYWFFKRATDWETDQPFYYFRLMEPDFTPLPAYGAIQEYATADPERQIRPAWWYLWQQNRPSLILLGAAVLVYNLLRKLLAC